MDGLRGDENHQPHVDSGFSHSRSSSESSRNIESIRGTNTRSIRDVSNGSSITGVDGDDDEDGTLPPPPLSSPSVASSLGLSNSVLSPLPRDHSRSTLHDEAESEADEPALAGRHALARRLNHLAQQLTDGDEVDDVALNNQIERMERTLIHTHQLSRPRHLRHMSLDMRDLASSSASSLSRSRFSELSLSLLRETEPEHVVEELPKRGMSAQQAKKVISEAVKLNDELGTIVSNLRARQEESDHIHGLLIERAERAAQRIIFLQNRISYLESELCENDEELQHLRICLKAVEVQMPPHPDEELQRCISTFKDDYRELKNRRAGRASVASIASFDESQVDGSPMR